MCHADSRLDTRVPDGIFHDFHHAWIEEIKRALNAGVLPEGYYALAEQHAAGFGPDVLTLQGRNENGDGDEDDGGDASVVRFRRDGGAAHRPG